MSELLSALSHALDMTEGQPEGHCVRCCYIGMRIGRAIGLSEHQLWELYYVLLLKDLGCSSNAARICQLYLHDDLAFKRDFKTVGDRLPQVLRFVVSHTGLKAGLAERFRAILNIVQNGTDIARDLIETRCQRGAAIARQLRFSEDVALGIQSLDEHWNGLGKATGLAGEAIPVYARVALLAQVVDVFWTGGGPAAAAAEVAARSGSWFDPNLAAAFARLAGEPEFWTTLGAPDLSRAILGFEPAVDRRVLDEDYLDDIADAFAQVVDSKSPFTSGHSTRVAFFADMIAAEMDFAPDHRRWLKRGALLHDIGKLGVSNSILDKPGKLDDAEFAAIRLHPVHTETILSRIEAFRELARMAGGHHEKLDGTGYPHRIGGSAIRLETRVITTADIFDALTADRPYRGPMPVQKALGIMAGEVGTAIDPRCFDALLGALAKLDRTAPDPALRPDTPRVGTLDVLGKLSEPLAAAEARAA